MKKFLLSIITLMYMAVSSGVAMEIHYCMGKRAGVDFYKTENDKCSRCGMKEKKSGCCHDEHQFHKLEDSHKTTYNTISFEQTEKEIATSFPLHEWQLATGAVTKVFHISDPPEYSGPLSYIRNRVFRI